MSKLEDIVAFSDIQITARAEPTKGDAFDIELTSLSLRFTENGIPKAVLKVALGESPQQGGGTIIAAAHAKVNKLERRTKITVKAKLKGHQTVNDKWDKGGNFAIFIGFLTRPAYSMGLGAAGLVLEVDHWLSDLATTHKLSYICAAVSAAHHTRPALVESFTGGKAAFDGSKVTYDPKAPDQIWQTTKELFKFLASKDRFEAKDMALVGTESIQNQVALDALDRMDKGRVMPLALQGIGEGLRNRSREALTTIIAAKDTGASYWETLLYLSREFMFSVIPTVYTATCVPVVKTVTKVWKKIGADEYHQFQIGGQIRALPIRSVGLYSSANWFTLDTRGLTQREFVTESNLIGYWDLAAENPENAELAAGQIIMSQTPGWMVNSSGAFSPYTPINLPRFGPIKTAANAKAAGKAPDKDDPNTLEKEVIDKNNPDRLGNKLARTMLSDISWRDRQGTIQGRLRFDIAPGSPVAVEIIGKNVPFYRASLKGDEGLLYAHVYQVSIDIDATQPSASTTLHLSHMRTSAEQKSFKSIVLAEHPLYGTPWGGTDLLDGKEGIEEAEANAAQDEAAAAKAAQDAADTAQLIADLEAVLGVQ